MQIVSQKVSTCVATVTIEYGKEGAFGPAITFLLRRFLHIKHDRDSIFVVISNNTLIGVGSIRLYDTILLDRVLSRLKIRKLHVGKLKRLRRGGDWTVE